MQNPLLCKDLQAIGALKKHLEKNHTLLSVVSFQSYDKNSILLAWILGFCVNELSFFLSYDKIVLCQRCHSRHCRRQCKIFCQSRLNFSRKQHIRSNNQHKKLNLLICLCFFLSKLLNKFMSNQIMPKLCIFINFRS